MPHIHPDIDFTVGALIVHDGRVCLVHHKQLNKWLEPGGHIELNENTDQALFREIEEETGLAVDDLEALSERPMIAGRHPPEFRSLFRPQWVNIHPINETHRHVGFFYVFRAKHATLQLAASEHHAIRWATLSEIRDPSLSMPDDLRWYAEEAIRIATS